MRCFFVFYLWLRRGGRRCGRFTRQQWPLLKRMQARICLMIHLPPMLRKPKWILRICSALLKQAWRTVIDENDMRQPACARGVLACAKQRLSLIKHARVEYNAVAFLCCKMNIKMRNSNTDTQPTSEREALFRIFALLIFHIHIHVSSSHTSSFMMNLCTFVKFDIRGFHTDGCSPDFPGRWLRWGRPCLYI